MNQTGGALAMVESWLRAILAFFINIFAVIETALRQFLSQLGLAADVQSIVILVVMILFIVAVIRFFGGLFRILLALFLVLLVLHILLPNSGI